MRIFVTGGTGLIGRALCKALSESGHHLTVLSRDPAAAKLKCGPGVEIVDSLEVWTPASRFDAVINLAGEPIADRRWSESRKRALWESRVDLTRRLVEAMGRADQKPAVLIGGSAIGVYGDRGDETLDEASDCRGEGFSERLCAAWEAETLNAAALGIRVCLLRTGLVVAPRGGFLARMLPLFKLGLGGRIGDGRQWMSWVHLDDHIALTRFLIDSPHLAGVFNATAPRPVTNAEFTARLAAALKRPALLPVPAGPLRLGLGEMAELLLGGQRVLPGRAREAGFEFRFETLESALRDVLG